MGGIFLPKPIPGLGQSRKSVTEKSRALFFKNFLPNLSYRKEKERNNLEETLRTFKNNVKKALKEMNFEEFSENFREYREVLAGLLFKGYYDINTHDNDLTEFKKELSNWFSDYTNDLMKRGLNAREIKEEFEETTSLLVSCGFITNEEKENYKKKLDNMVQMVHFKSQR